MPAPLVLQGLAVIRRCGGQVLFAPIAPGFMLIPPTLPPHSLDASRVEMHPDT